MIFQSWRDFSSFILTQILLYLFCFEYVSSLAWINVGFINYLVELVSLVWTQKWLCFLAFLNLYSCWYVSILFHMMEVTQQRHSAVASLPVSELQNNCTAQLCYAKFRWAVQGRTEETSSLSFYGLLKGIFKWTFEMDLNFELLQEVDPPASI